ncbi:MAG: DUF3990 domain-containing protein [Prevotellaceae bacterium]|jgi:hypothetical protein|nr:DUF3990 domain-containing protein [Prevotellaceae bacterium]
MKVYHGSYLKIEDIDLSKCEPRKDFGQGFYVTKFREQAEIWAKRKGRDNHTEEVVTEFNFFESVFADKNFKTLRFEKYNNAWLDFVVLNRNYNTPLPAHDYDLIEGPVADDKITTRIDAYIRGELSRENFLAELTYEPSHQICFSTVKSLSMLEHTDFKGITAIERTSEKIVENLIINCGISEMQAADLLYSSMIYNELTTTENELYKKPWQEIYEMLKKELALKA